MLPKISQHGTPKQVRRLAAIAALALFPALLLLVAAQAGAARWQIQCVDCPKQFDDLTDRSLQLDNAGRPHIAYGGDHLYYAWYDGSNWHDETVDGNADVGRFASLALDQAGYAHIAYYDANNQNLKYAFQDVQGWHVTTLDTEGNVGKHASLALDGRSQPHISYLVDSPDYNLKYAYRDAAGWHFEIADDYWVAGFTSLALDHNGFPHVSYSTDGYDLKYAHKDTTGWHVEVVYYGSGVEDTSLALDASDYPHIAFFNEDYDYEGLAYAYLDGAGWHFAAIDDADNSSVSLALDGYGYAHISYYDTVPQGYLKYAHQDAQGWHTQSLVTADNTSFSENALAVTGYGFPRIVYLRKKSAVISLEYTYRNLQVWNFETVDPGGYVGSPSLALGMDNSRHVGYSDATNQVLRYAYLPGSQQVAAQSDWQTETVEDGASYSHISLAVDPDGDPHIGYYATAWPEYWVKYAYRDGTGWHVETVVSRLGRWPEGYTSLALDGLGLPHLSYVGCADSSCGLWYAHRDAAGWHVESAITSTTAVGISLALDDGGSPHISFAQSSGSALKYAHRAGGGWQVDTVDTVLGPYGDKTSLALDQAGYPHIAYYNREGLNLKYAYQDAAGWHIESIDSGYVLSQYPSLVLDQNDKAHIAFSVWDGLAFNGLCLAHRDASGWLIETVDTAGASFRLSSLALDENDQYHVVYEVSNDLDCCVLIIGR